MVETNIVPGEPTDKHGATVSVEIEIRADGSVLWVNVDGFCTFRLCRIEAPIKIIDHRPRTSGIASMQETEE